LSGKQRQYLEAEPLGYLFHKRKKAKKGNKDIEPIGEAAFELVGRDTTNGR